MADNVTLNAGTGGDVVRTKDRSGTETQIVGLDLNPAGSTEALSSVGASVSGTLAAANAAVTIATTGAGGVGIYWGNGVTGNFIVEGTVDGTNWLPAISFRSDQSNWASGSIVPGVGYGGGVTYAVVAPNFGYSQMRLRVSSYTSGSTTGVIYTIAAMPMTIAALVQPGSTPAMVRIYDGSLQAGLVDETGASAVDALAVGGGTPHDAVDSGNPVKIGAKAASAFPTAVASADRANLIADLFGRLMTTHIDPAQQMHRNRNYTTQQTGGDVITPTSGKKLAITSVTIGSYGTTAGRVILWFGDNADTSFTQDTDQVLVAASFAPSANSKPGLVFCPAVPVFCTTADRELHISTDAAISLDICIEYYEF